MDELTPEELLAQLRELDEHPRIEAKQGQEIGASIMQTICAFANEPGLGGGWLLLGVSEPNTTQASFWPSGVTNSDKLLNDLQVNCREQFEQPITVRGRPAVLEEKRVIVVFVPELDIASKPCTFKGRFDAKNKRKTGVWRRGLNGDYECSQQELEPLLLAKAGLSFEQMVLPSAQWTDLDPDMIARYRSMRHKVRPYAEELQANDEDLLQALNVVVQEGEQWRPNVAGLLLFGKPLSIRRLLPAVRVDYVRIRGIDWVEDPHERFVNTWESREPVLKLIPKLVATILDDMPSHFHLNDGEAQRSDEPILPHQVVREAVVNALMHRDYSVHQPTLIARFRNRLELRNAGYSLKPEAMLGQMGSRLRNPILAAVLYDLNLAETKGSGIRTMRRLLEQAQLSAPVFSSSPSRNEFSAVYLLQHLLNHEQHQWLQRFSDLRLSAEEATALVLARQLGAVDNGALRSVTGLDTLTASQLLRKLSHQLNILVRGGSGSTTYYQLAKTYADESTPATLGAMNTGDLRSNTGDLRSNTGDLRSNTGDLRSNTGDLPSGLEEELQRLSPKARREKLWPIILKLCAIRARTASELAQLLGRQVGALKASHLNVLRTEKAYLKYLYPEVVNHPQQAYVLTHEGELWLEHHAGDKT